MENISIENVNVNEINNKKRKQNVGQKKNTSNHEMINTPTDIAISGENYKPNELKKRTQKKSKISDAQNMEISQEINQEKNSLSLKLQLKNGDNLDIVDNYNSSNNNEEDEKHADILNNDYKTKDDTNNILILNNNNDNNKLNSILPQDNSDDNKRINIFEDGNLNRNNENIKKKNNKEIISELKNTLNIVENSNAQHNIEGLNKEEIKMLDSWYFANKMKIIPYLFDDKPIHINLLNSLYMLHPYFKNHKTKIIIYLRFVKNKYENIIKKNNEKYNNETIEIECKATILKILGNKIENFKDIQYMDKVITLIQNENSYINVKYFFYFILDVSNDYMIYNNFLQQNGLLCIKNILHNIAEKKIIKKNIPLLIILLNFLKNLNINLNHLKTTLIGIPINFIARNKIDEQHNLDYVTDNNKVRELAKELINKWKLIRDQALNNNNNSNNNNNNYYENQNDQNGQIEIVNINKVQKDIEEAQKENANNNKYNNNNNNNNNNFMSNMINTTTNHHINILNDNKPKSNKKSPNSISKNENKNIMLEIIDNINEEYEKKKKRHLEYKKAKIEGKIKKFSALKNSTEIKKKTENLLTNLISDNMIRPHSDNNNNNNNNNNNKIHSKPIINNNIMSHNMNAMDYNDIYSNDRKNYNNNINNEHLNSDIYNDGMASSYNHMNKNVYSQNYTRVGDHSMDSPNYMNKYNINNGHNSNEVSANRQPFSQYAPINTPPPINKKIAHSNNNNNKYINDNYYNSSSMIPNKYSPGGRYSPSTPPTKQFQNEKYGNFSPPINDPLINKNNYDRYNYNPSNRQTYDRKGNEKNYKPSKFSTKRTNKFSYDEPSFDNNINVKDAKQNIKDPFEYYSNNNMQKEPYKNNKKLEIENIRNLLNNDAIMSSQQYNNNDINEPMNVQTMKNDNNIKNSKQRHIKEQFESLNLLLNSSNNNSNSYDNNNMDEPLDSNLNDIFSFFKKFENVKENYQINKSDFIYPSSIFHDSEIKKNDIIITFKYDSHDNIPIYIKYNTTSNKNIINTKFSNNNYPNQLNNMEPHNNKDRNHIINNSNQNFNLLSLSELFHQSNINELKLPPIIPPILPNLNNSQNIIPPIVFPYNNSNDYANNNTNINCGFSSDNISYNNKSSINEFVKIFDEGIQKILLKNKDLANLLMNKPDIVQKMLKGPQYINEALSSLENELKNWNR
ncbi:conserved Plasmodium protein, unknown function [Plasmodium sp. gorilla clade G3]|nr:conserved Plasmodium protein, unknown function [Plasmodium sp. gorilla clade G3]